MPTNQYTIRNIPPAVDSYLRKRARISGQSLNQVVIDELSQKVSLPDEDLVSRLDWFIGDKSIGEDVNCALDDDDKIQKQMTQKDW